MNRRTNGEGSVYRRQDGRWVGATFAHRNAGGRKRVYVYGRTRAEAREKLALLERDLDSGVRVSVENWNVQGYLEHWLEPSFGPPGHPRRIRDTSLLYDCISPHASGNRDSGPSQSGMFG